MRTKIFNNSSHLKVLGVLDTDITVERSLLAFLRERSGWLRRRWRSRCSESIMLNIDKFNSIILNT